MNRFKLSLAALLVPALLSGCWDRTELNELAITSAAALDWEKDAWKLSFQVIIPSAISAASGTVGGPSSQVPVVVHSTYGPTIKDAVAKSYLEAPRKLYFGHNSVLVIGEKAARRGLSQIIDLYLRNADSRETVSVLISNNGRSILEQLINMDPIPGHGIQRILEKEDRNVSILPNVRMYELTKQLLSPSKGALLPEIIISGGQEVTGIDQLKKTTMPSKLRLSRAAVIKDDKLVGWMSEYESMGAAFLANKVKSSDISFSCQQDESGNKDSTFTITSSKTEYKVKEKDGRFEVYATIRTKGRLNETGCALDLIKPQVVSMMEDRIGKEISAMTEAAWSTIQKLEADVTGFAVIINRAYPKQWKKAEKGTEPPIKKISLHTEVKVEMDKLGLSNKGYKIMNERK